MSGQGATDPATGELAGADVETQTEQCLKNLQAILQAGGSDLQHVLRCGVFLIDMKEFQQMNGVYARMFGDHRPARTTIQAAGLPGRRVARRDRLHRLRAIESISMMTCSIAACSLAVLALVVALPLVGHANEGFWPFNRIPKAAIKQALGVDLSRPVDPARAAGVGPVPGRLGLVRVARRAGADQPPRVARHCCTS